MKLALVVSPLEEEIKQLPRLKPLFAGHSCTVIYKCPDTVTELAMEYDGVIVAQEAFLQKLADKKRISIDNYAGSFYMHSGKPFVVVDPLKFLVLRPEGEFVFKRYLSKIVRPDLWQSEVPFEWEEVTTWEKFNTLLALASAPNVLAMSIDIETDKPRWDKSEPPKLLCPAHIQICSYSIIYHVAGQIKLRNFTFDINAPHRHKWMNALNQTPVPKIFQNGIYDNTWFIHYNVPPRNWCLDTMDLFHSWYSELPKSLDFVTSFCVRNVAYWKADNKTGDRQDFLRYGCMDVWATSCSFLYLLEALPYWAWKNYVQKFPLNFPSILVGLRGWKIDEKVRATVKEEQIPEVEDNKKLLRAITRAPNFNPNSSPQLVTLLNTINCGKKTLTSADKNTVKTVATQHALNEFICKAIQDFKKASRLVSSYLQADLVRGKDPNFGRFLYSLAPSGSDTARFTSYGSALYCGNSIQTIPRGNVIKSFFIADDGYYLAEPDAEQAEDRCVAYLSGDEALLSIYIDTPQLDSHRLKANKFFGVPYDEIDEALRDLSKRVNHGANYNMGPVVLLITMGVANVLRAQKLLGLPKEWSLRKICTHLLDVYAATFPRVKGPFYDYLTDQVRATHMVTSPLGWTRYFFGKPWDRKPDLNALVAHVPQNLNVGIINESFLKLYDFEKKCGGQIKLLAQIHDSLPFQYKIGRLDLAVEVCRIMERPVSIRDCEGKTRQMVIPIGLKAEDTRWSDLKKIKNWRELNA